MSVKPIKKYHVFDLLKNILASKGYTLRDTGMGFIKVIKSSDASKSAPPMYGQSQIGEVETVIIPIRNLNVRTILRQVNFLLSRYGKISLSNENNSIVVTDYPENIKTIKNIIDKLDQDRNNKVAFITLENAQAKSVYPKARQLVNAMFDNRIQTQKVTVFSDDASNSIVLIGNPENIAQITPYIRRMDSSDDTVDKKMDIIYIKNADATEIVKTLEKLLSDKSFAKAKSAEEKTVTTHIPQKSKNGRRLPPIVKTEKIKPSIIGGEDKPTVTVDAELNAIIVYATQSELREIRSVVESLDVERQQVYVVAKILEISEKKAKALGAKYEVLAGISSGSGLYGIGMKLLNGSLSPLSTVKTLANLELPKLKKALATGITIDLLDANGVTKILSQPSILCINNKESTIYVGQTESILTQSSQASSITAVPINNYKREDIGLTLKVKPRISADNKVSLDVTVKSEDVEKNTKQNTAQPTTTKREVTTSSIVTNGETVIIGGLTKDKTDESSSRIPLLGRIPILGIPFRNNSDSYDKKTLVIMLTPYIVKRSEDLSKLREDLSALSGLERELALKFDRDIKSGKKFEEVQPEEYIQTNTYQVENTVENTDDCNALRKEFEVDEYGREYNVYYDTSGIEVKREEIPLGAD
ncbi:MAG: type II secretion system protein GspD [Sulfurospirillum sp.]|nr:MAG: type II secretion system protein GspD [Sulfurospirillum sp.]